MNGAFRRSVVEQSLTALETGDRSRVHDRTSLLHVLQSCFGHVEVCVDVCFERTIPLFFSNVVDSFLMLLKRRVVDEDVELSELVDSLRDEFFANFRIAYIA